MIAGSRARVGLGENDTVTINKTKEPEEFTLEFQGMIKEGSPARKGEDPLKLKEIWGKR
ncbi:MAG TPA: hypothetical protein VFF30_13880 [Nitrososphaerales archaeon]|nr:hypothetical protein [Nitrososphaerales archaeon]